MPENYAELRLYFGILSDSCRGEGRYEREPTSQQLRIIIARAREHIQQWLQPSWRERGLRIGWNDGCVASSEEEVLSLIAHAEASFDNATGAVVPLDRMHGSTRFHRVIRFAGATRTQADEIISIMKQSDHVPYKLEPYERHYFTEEEKAQLMDEKWKAALKFY